MPPCDSVQGYHLPDDWLHSASGDVVAEVGGIDSRQCVDYRGRADVCQINYNPRIIALLQQVQRVRANEGFPWAIVDGLEVLLEQGTDAFEIVTGRPAPRKIMTDETYDQDQGMWWFLRRRG